MILKNNKIHNTNYSHKINCSEGGMHEELQFKMVF
jgi:hypothetical protein